MSRCCLLSPPVIEPCVDAELHEFPLRMRDWLKNVLVTLYERDVDHNLLTEKQKLRVRIPFADLLGMRCSSSKHLWIFDEGDTIVNVTLGALATMCPHVARQQNSRSRSENHKGKNSFPPQISNVIGKEKPVKRLQPGGSVALSSLLHTLTTVARQEGRRSAALRLCPPPLR